MQEENPLSASLLNLSEDRREFVYKQLSNRNNWEKAVGRYEAFYPRPMPGLMTVGGEKGKQIISEAYNCVGLPPHVSFKSDLAFLDLKGKVPLSWIVRDAPLALNIHPAPPEKRGAGVYVPSLLAGESHYGCTAHFMSPSGLDDGRIIAVKRFKIPEGSTKTSLRALTTEVCLEMLEELLILLKFTKPVTSIPTTCHYTWGGEEFTRKAVRKNNVERD